MVAKSCKFITAFAVLSLTGCATLFSGTRDTITVDSTPQGATVLIDGLEMGRTPATFPLKRPGLGTKTVELRMAGYETRRFELQSDFNLVSILNLTNPLAWGVDVLTGSIKKYDPKNYSITMQRSRTSMAEQLRVDHVVMTYELPTDAEGKFIIPAGAEGKKVAVVDVVTGEAIILQ
jgi:hypothetical protein